jgi:hypothetical protein
MAEMRMDAESRQFEQGWTMSQAGLLCFPPAEDDQEMVVGIEGPANEDDLQFFFRKYFLTHH